MSERYNIYNKFAIKNIVDNPVVTNPYTVTISAF